MLFILEVTFFVALTVLDERRRESRRVFLCLASRDATWKPSACSQRQYLKMFFERIYAPILLKTPVKVTPITFYRISFRTFQNSSDKSQTYPYYCFMPK